MPPLLQEVPWYRRLLNPDKLYTVPKLAEVSSLPRDTIYDLFRDEEGVLLRVNARRGIRRYVTRWIPGDVAIRRFARMTNGGAR